MTIRAILRHGIIQPVEPLPPDWAEGQELVVEEPIRHVNAWHVLPDEVPAATD